MFAAVSSRTSRLARTFLAMIGTALLIVSMPTVASAAVLNPLPPNATDFQRNFQPYFDYDSDSCFPAAAIDASGRLNGGLDDSGPVTGQCRSGHLGNANT